MIKQTVIAASVFAFQPQQAQAGSKVQTQIGVPAFGYYEGHRPL